MDSILIVALLKYIIALARILEVLPEDIVAMYDDTEGQEEYNLKLQELHTKKVKEILSNFHEKY